MKFVELSDAEFGRFEQTQACGNFFQSAERAELRRKMGRKVVLLGVKQGEEILAGSLVMITGGEALVQLGPILDYEKPKVLKFWLNGVLDYCRKAGVVDLEVYPCVKICDHACDGEVLKSYEYESVEQIMLEAGAKYMGRTVKLENKANRWMVIKDLSGLTDMTAVRATYKKNVRNKLRKVAPEQEIYELKSKDELPSVVAVINNSNDKNGVIGRDLKYYEDIWDAWGEKVRFIAARKKDDQAVTAARILFYHPNEVVSFLSGTAHEYKQLNGMTVLQDWLFEDCLARGITRVNLYGLPRGEFVKGNQLLEFKSGFGVFVEEYLGGFRFVLRPGKYNSRKVVAGAKGVLRAAYKESKKISVKLRKK